MEILLSLALEQGAARLGDGDYGIAVGKRGDLVILPAATPTQAVIDHPVRTYVIKGGRVVAANGALV
jgi:cytosine/adenosine deaminase-related metal-dependent hydrolase